MNSTDSSGSKRLLPVLLDLSSQHVVLLSGESFDEMILPVARMLSPCTDHLTVFSPDPSPPLKELAEREHFVLKEKSYKREDLYDADLVILSASGQALKDEVFAACRTLGIRLSILSEPKRSDFILDQVSGCGARQPQTEDSLCVKTATASAQTKASVSENEAGSLLTGIGQEMTEKKTSPRATVAIYTDGSSRGNPGPGGYGAILEWTDAKGVLHTKELSQGYEKTTNNRMELMGAIAALEALARPCDVTLWSDSKYLVNAFNEHWIDGWIRSGWMRTKKEPVRNTDLWKRLLAAAAPHSVAWNWVKGHSSHPQNERCDALATAAADSDRLIPDPGLETGA